MVLMECVGSDRRQVTLLGLLMSGAGTGDSALQPAGCQQEGQAHPGEARHEESLHPPLQPGQSRRGERCRGLGGFEAPPDRFLEAGRPRRGRARFAQEGPQRVLVQFWRLIHRHSSYP